MSPFLISGGDPLRMGVNQTPKGHNFALFSDQASLLDLLIFDQTGALLSRFSLDPLRHRTGSIWHIEISGLPEVFNYSYQVKGVSGPLQSFDPDQELLDPYAKGISGFEYWGKRTGLPMRGMWAKRDFDWEGDRPLGRPLKDSVIYELHVRGFTQAAEVENPGTFRGVIERIPYLKDLGVTAVELMPIHEFDEFDCPFLDPVTKTRHKNYWGYSSINFFSIKSAYASDKSPMGDVAEFKAMVKALHNAGIEVILDVVFNHTAEGGEQGRVINFKGLSANSYYMLDANGHYANYSGCGNTFNCNHPVVKRMILDSLQYFVAELHVDGFRFDLASIMSRNEKGEVLAEPPVLESIAKDPLLSNTKIIAEAWDAAGLYQVGSFPASGRWAEWNGRFRDTVRCFAKGDKGLTAELATRLAGSEDLYKHSQRNPYHSINFITSHDGFTLMDLVSYQNRHNLANGEEGRDGEQHNLSFNFGVEGPSEAPRILQLRHRQIRNFATLLFISQGTPMFPMGDEIGKTQGGNNNPWCQDNATSWLDWSLAEKNAELLAFYKALIRFRKAHPHLHKRNFFTGRTNLSSHLPDISWHAQRAWEPEFDHGNNKLALLIDGYQGPIKKDQLIYAALNFEPEPKHFEIPQSSSG
ncbi:MAG: hypothetical protein A2508_06280, partial [Candidatus Lambdaproteobacteria bacterium RIFOXYD12_FULL_49_8]